ncbi:MAG TPA: hypothetical protein VG942_17580 [Hyphomonadaceae bacterium]|nr:hypothetical protein [Hyphomonadaceae bacterium]
MPIGRRDDGSAIFAVDLDQVVARIDPESVVAADSAAGCGRDEIWADCTILEFLNLSVASLTVAFGFSCSSSADKAFAHSPSRLLASSAVRLALSEMFLLRVNGVMLALLQSPDRSGWPKALRAVGATVFGG